MCHLSEGSYFGEIALLSSDHKRTADVVAIEICKTYRLPRKIFKECIAVEEHIISNIESLAEERRKHTRALEEWHKAYILEKSHIHNLEDLQF